MNQELLGTMLQNFSPEDKEEFFEAMAIVGDDVSRRIILEAASPHTPVTIDEFVPDISEETMVRHVNLLEAVGILKPEWYQNHRRYAITPFGRIVADILAKSVIATPL